ncbi:PREDICTED: uncharacterized protein LOC106817162 [Priapulus caudatus]|uniref:Uncharacterized protein LOC106817162 n=1 Tax=Priapulus caudatus TaxID=37621 RepID=A0ABM1EYN1_PRICU|nr:PREDICTED: uncharacterized protein LOC106817162 [Priapulus caudatus]
MHRKGTFLVLSTCLVLACAAVAVLYSSGSSLHHSLNKRAERTKRELSDGSTETADVALPLPPNKEDDKIAEEDAITGNEVEAKAYPAEKEGATKAAALDETKQVSPLPEEDKPETEDASPTVVETPSTEFVVASNETWPSDVTDDDVIDDDAEPDVITDDILNEVRPPSETTEMEVDRRIPVDIGYEDYPLTTPTPPPAARGSSAVPATTPSVDTSYDEASDATMATDDATEDGGVDASVTTGGDGRDDDGGRRGARERRAARIRRRQQRNLAERRTRR